MCCKEEVWGSLEGWWNWKMQTEISGQCTGMQLYGSLVDTSRVGGVHRDEGVCKSIVT